MSTNRTAARQALGSLLTLLMGDGNPVQAVYDHGIGDFGGQSPVVIVKSGGTNRFDSTYSKEWDNSFYLVVETWVLYSDPDSDWDEEDAEDRLDLIDKSMAELLSTYRSHGDNWDFVNYAERSQVYEVNLGGNPWLREVYTLLVQKDDAN